MSDTGGGAYQFKYLEQLFFWEQLSFYLFFLNSLDMCVQNRAVTKKRPSQFERVKSSVFKCLDMSNQTQRYPVHSAISWRKARKSSHFRSWNQRMCSICSLLLLESETIIKIFVVFSSVDQLIISSTNCFSSDEKSVSF